MAHRNAQLGAEGRRRLIARCQTRPIAHVAAEIGISRACASKWDNRWRRHGEAGLQDRPSTPRNSPTATPPEVIRQIEAWRGEHKWSARWITDELADLDVVIDRRTAGRPPPEPTRTRPTTVHRPQPREGGLSETRLCLRALHPRRPLPARLHRTNGRRERGHRSRIPRPCEGLVCRPRHRSHPANRHRQRRLLQTRGIRPDRRRPDPTPGDQALHAPPRREGGALTAHPGRRTPLRPGVHQQGRAIGGYRRLEHRLRLPPAAQRHRPSAAARFNASEAASRTSSPPTASGQHCRESFL